MGGKAVKRQKVKKGTNKNEKKNTIVSGAHLVPCHLLLQCKWCLTENKCLASLLRAV